MGNWIQILVIVLVIGGPILGQILQSLEKQRKQRQRQKELEAHHHEALRTGHTVSTQRPRPAATTQLQELQRRRQQQLEELRRRQQAARQSGGGPQHPAPARVQTRTQTQTRAPRPTGQQAHRPPARSASQSNPLPPPRTPRQTPQTRPAVPARGTTAVPQPVRRTPRPARPVPRTTESDTPESSIHDLQIDPHVQHPCTEATVAPVKIMGKTMDATDWRRFIVARELLSPPLALRRPGQDPLG